MKKLKIAVIYGGANSEHEVSIASARSIISNLNKKMFEVVPVYISKKGEWFMGDHFFLASTASIKTLRELTRNIPLKMPGKQEIALIPHAIAQVDVVFPVLHGKLGEDGTLQGLLEMLHIPYVGSKVLASAMCMDKDIQKQLCHAHQIPVTKYKAITATECNSAPVETIQSIEQEVAYPVFVKPANAGSSVGVSKASNRKELVTAIKIASPHDRKILVEQAIYQPREIECAILGNDNPKSSVLGEIIPKRAFYDYEAKYVSNDSGLIIPADLPLKTTHQISQIALQAFKVMQCAGLARVDFLVERKTNKIYLNELNTMPGFTPISMYPKLWEASGLAYGKLLEQLIAFALKTI